MKLLILLLLVSCASDPKNSDNEFEDEDLETLLKGTK